MEIAAITAGPQCLGAAETDFFQVTEGVIVTFTEKTTGFRAAARRAGIMPETLMDGQVKFLRLFLKVLPQASLEAVVFRKAQRNTEKNRGIHSRPVYWS